MLKIKYICLTVICFSLTCAEPASEITADKPLSGIRIMVDPGHGNSAAYDFFRVGQKGEREEWINLRVGKHLVKMLSDAGAIVFSTRVEDQDVSLGGRAALASIHECDLFICIHHNGSGDPNFDSPIVYFWGSAIENPASVDLAKMLVKNMQKYMTFEQQKDGATYSDFLIYSNGTSVLRNTVAHMPGIIGEAGFFTNTHGEERLMSDEYNRVEAETYLKTIVAYAKKGIPKALPVKPPKDTILAEGQTLEFKLSDGLDGSHFQESTIRVLQGEEELPFFWSEETGILHVQPKHIDHKTILIRVFGRNSNGNALHPRQWIFKTEAYKAWHSVDQWSKAFNQAEQHFINLEKACTDGNTTLIKTEIEAALHFYQLSLELQHVHPKSRLAEEQILKCLILKHERLGMDTLQEIEIQKQKLEELYPL